MTTTSDSVYCSTKMRFTWVILAVLWVALECLLHGVEFSPCNSVLFSGSERVKESPSTNNTATTNESPENVPETTMWEKQCRVVLATYPNSGTSWSLQVFAASTNVKAETIYPGTNRQEFPWGTYAEYAVGNPADDNAGECHFIKSHYTIPESKIHQPGNKLYYQRAVILHRDIDDNFGATIRYLNKTRQKTLQENPCSIQSWYDSGDIKIIEQFHRISHTNYYCHWQNNIKSIPKFVIKYEHMMAHPAQSFAEMFTYVGYPNANVTRGLERFPPHGGGLDDTADPTIIQQYQPLSDEVCATNFYAEFQAIQRDNKDKCWWKVIHGLYRTTPGIRGPPKK